MYYRKKTIYVPVGRKKRSYRKKSRKGGYWR